MQIVQKESPVSSPEVTLLPASCVSSRPVCVSNVRAARRAQVSLREVAPVRAPRSLSGVPRRAVTRVAPGLLPAGAQGELFPRCRRTCMKPATKTWEQGCLSPELWHRRPQVAQAHGRARSVLSDVLASPGHTGRSSTDLGHTYKHPHTNDS